MIKECVGWIMLFEQYENYFFLDSLDLVGNIVLGLGLWQGDILYPYLFVVEGPSTLIN